MAYFQHYQNAGPGWGTRNYQFGRPPSPDFQPQPKWQGLDYYRAHAQDGSDPFFFHYALERCFGQPNSTGVPLLDARRYHRMIYGGLVPLSTALPSEYGHAAAYEAYRMWKYNSALSEPVGGDYERQREAIVGLAIAEATHLWRRTGRAVNKVDCQAACEAAASTATLIFTQNEQQTSFGGMGSQYGGGGMMGQYGGGQYGGGMQGQPNRQYSRSVSPYGGMGPGTLGGIGGMNDMGMGAGGYGGMGGGYNSDMGPGGGYNNSMGGGSPYLGVPGGTPYPYQGGGGGGYRQRSHSMSAPGSPYGGAFPIDPNVRVGNGVTVISGGVPPYAGGGNAVTVLPGGYGAGQSYGGGQVGQPYGGGQPGQVYGGGQGGYPMQGYQQGYGGGAGYPGYGGVGGVGGVGGFALSSIGGMGGYGPGPGGLTGQAMAQAPHTIILPSRRRHRRHHVRRHSSGYGS
ncbi:hypothetical protein JAAARDRAFT_194199 [Jaapia argillacea MUCL 33604]|uniref:Uncharacterized protein n=1 Tax=Jaapia argillacea MUCL 33604 TaxID=933084 RepID=A0A067PT39_9AGAM|nr:hypothetical protein JAAARDRAFT_194199 [Jaapia argillacea MUCL 33604]